MQLVDDRDRDVGQGRAARLRSEPSKAGAYDAPWHVYLGPGTHQIGKVARSFKSI